MYTQKGIKIRRGMKLNTKWPNLHVICFILSPTSLSWMIAEENVSRDKNNQLTPETTDLKSCFFLKTMTIDIPGKMFLAVKCVVLVTFLVRNSNYTKLAQSSITLSTEDLPHLQQPQLIFWELNFKAVSICLYSLIIFCRFCSQRSEGRGVVSHLCKIFVHCTDVYEWLLAMTHRGEQIPHYGKKI